MYLGQLGYDSSTSRRRRSGPRKPARPLTRNRFRRMRGMVGTAERSDPARAGALEEDRDLVPSALDVVGGGEGVETRSDLAQEARRDVTSMFLNHEPSGCSKCISNVYELSLSNRRTDFTFTLPPPAGSGIVP